MRNHASAASPFAAAIGRAPADVVPDLRHSCGGFMLALISTTDLHSNVRSDRPAEYQTVVRGELSDRFAAAFPEMTLQPEAGYMRVLYARWEITT